MTKEVRPFSRVARACWMIALRLRIDARGGFVQDQDARVGQQGARKRDQLALPDREQDPALFYRGIVTLAQVHDEIMRTNSFRQLPHFIVGGFQASKTDIFCHRAIEQERVLQHDAHLAAQALLGHLAQIIPVD